MSPITILITDDDTNHRNMLMDLISDWHYTTHPAPDGETAVSLAKQTPYDLILMDIRMPGISGLEALKQIKEYNPSIPILIMTAYSDVDTAVTALKSGAYDYLTKPLDFDELKLAIERALDHTSLKEENKSLRATIANTLNPTNLIGQSPAMKQLMEMLATVAPSTATVLITGESGTGKEVVAKLIHANSPRANGPFIAINCAAISEQLLESELFGHEKGAFTGADKQREGRFLAANNGTIFLDEIGEMSLPMQARLLRAIQEREIQRVGSDRAIKVDVRILAATNRNLQEEVENNRFRQDLYYRLNVVTLDLPPLRERPQDIPLLANHFLKRFAQAESKQAKGFTPGAMDRLVKYDWPGNVRELENMVERAVVLLMGDYVGIKELPPALVGDGGAEDDTPSLSGMTLEELEQAAVKAVMKDTGGNKSEAARRLGVTRKTLKAKLQKMNLGGINECADE